MPFIRRGEKKNMVFENILKNSYIQKRWYKSLFLSKKCFGNIYAIELDAQLSVENDEKMKNKKENWEERKKKDERKRKRSQGQQIPELKDIFLYYIFKIFFKWTVVTKQRKYLVYSVEIYLRPVSSDYTDFIRDRVEQHRAKETKLYT